MEDALEREAGRLAPNRECGQVGLRASQTPHGAPSRGNPNLTDSLSADSSLAQPGPSSAAAKTCWSASDLESRLTAAIAERTKGRLQALEVRVLGGRTVLTGLAGSYHTVQIAVACLLETLRALDLDHPDQIDLNIEVVPHRSPPSHAYGS